MAALGAITDYSCVFPQPLMPEMPKKPYHKGLFAQSNPPSIPHNTQVEQVRINWYLSHPPPQNF